ncbi:MAG: SUMF1/EgtB/PvdO family nonheme iron enzyme [Planctomycetota bacterium]|nr:SUMF1/EgtB/PvdO family nonheme iron enzyme [Planctomycetota bacterium]
MKLTHFCSMLVVLWTSMARAEHYAFLVGVREYDPTELTSLTFTENDVTELADAIKNAGYADENVVLMTQTVGARKSRFLPIVKNIQKELVLLCRELNDDDTLLVAFSGHGVQFKGSADVYFCPADAKLADKATLLSLTKVYELLGNASICKAKNKVLLVDACRNAPQSQVSKAAKEIELEPVGIKERPTPPGGIAAFFSCSQGQKSYEHPDLQHGVFINYVIEAFQGEGDLDRDGELSLAELEQYSVKATQKFARTVFGQAQTPERRGETRGLVTLATVTRSPRANPLRSTSTGMEFVLVKAGSFEMGSDETKAQLEAAGFVVPYDISDESPKHTVRITKPFVLGAKEVTVGQFRQFANATNYVTEAERDGKGGYGYNAATTFSEQKPEFSWQHLGFPQTDAYPVVNVTWNDAIAFCNWLSVQDKRPYRLPTEAEWEYACRAGSRTRYFRGDTPRSLQGTGNFQDASFESKFPKVDFAKYPSLPFDDGFPFSSPVGSFAPNAFGLFDMHGNVWEWCSDWYDKNYYATPVATNADPVGPATRSDRVGRGGSWFDFAAFVRSALRFRNAPGYRRNDLGFRLASSSVE